MKEKPVFKSGNTAMVAGLNSVADYAREHGVNPGGSPGWLQTPDGWKPPSVFMAASVESPWDLVAGEDEGTFKLRAPVVVAGITDLGTVIVIDNTPITLESDKFVVLKIDDVIADPYTFTLALKEVDESGGLEVYTFTDDDELETANLPLYKLADVSSDGSVRVGDFHAISYITPGIKALASHQVLIPDRPASAYVPRLVPLT
jgi:hypothetical protein